jgi:hypothetical protein
MTIGVVWTTKSDEKFRSCAATLVVGFPWGSSGVLVPGLDQSG